MDQEAIRKHYGAKRKSKKNKIEPKVYRKAVKLIRELWEEEQIENCKLYINKRGISYHSEARFQKDNIALVQIAMSEDLLLFQQLKEAGKFKGDFLRMVKMTTLHEIGHKKDTQLTRLKNERSMIRRKLFEAKSYMEWIEMSNQVWKLTKTIELNAWKYVHARISPEEIGDLIEYQHCCLRKYKESWEMIAESYLPHGIKDVA